MKNFQQVVTLWLSLLVVPAFGQWVTIPDPAFLAKLTLLFPDCTSGDSLNTQCPDVLNATTLFVGASGISDLTGIEYFGSLQELRCDANNLSTLPALPASLLILRFGNNPITAWPDLPNTLSELICSDLNLTFLPELPASLTELHCAYNNLTVLPELPSTLVKLNCNNNRVVRRTCG